MGLEGSTIFDFTFMNQLIMSMANPNNYKNSQPHMELLLKTSTMNKTPSPNLLRKLNKKRKTRFKFVINTNFQPIPIFLFKTQFFLQSSTIANTFFQNNKPKFLLQSSFNLAP